MKKIHLVLIIFVSIGAFFFTNYLHSETTESKIKIQKNESESLIIYINTAEFKEKIFDFDKNKDWKYNGSKPCIVDFYADWCGPCKKLLPILKDLSEEYKDRIIIYKVNVDNEKRLAEVFGVTSIPALLFCPMNGKPAMSNGYVAKKDLKEMINTNLFNNK